MVLPWFVILYFYQCLPATTRMELLIDGPDRLVPAESHGQAVGGGVLRIACAFFPAYHCWVI